MFLQGEDSPGPWSLPFSSRLSVRFAGCVFIHWPEVFSRRPYCPVPLIALPRSKIGIANVTKVVSNPQCIADGRGRLRFRRCATTGETGSRTEPRELCPRFAWARSSRTVATVPETASCSGVTSLFERERTLKTKSTCWTSGGGEWRQQMAAIGVS